MSPIEEIFDSLPGVWSLSRTIPNAGSMQGTATFTPMSPHELYYHEEGVFNQTLSETPFFRDYFYVLENGTIVLYFVEHGQKAGLFMILDFTSPTHAKSEHLCKQDLYQATFDFVEDTFTTRFTVKGPSKDYVIESGFKKMFTQ